MPICNVWEAMDLEEKFQRAEKRITELQAQLAEADKLFDEATYHDGRYGVSADWCNRVHKWRQALAGGEG